MLSEFAAQQGAKGIQVVGLAVDKSEAVLRFLQRQPVQFPGSHRHARGIGTEQKPGQLAGGLPFTVLFDAKGKCGNVK
jgi:hypothetical protein